MKHALTLFMTALSLPILVGSLSRPFVGRAASSRFILTLGFWAVS